MNKELIGAAVVAILVITAISHWRGQPDKGNYKAATQVFPRLHLYKGKDDADASIDLYDSDAHAFGRLLLDDGRVFGPKDRSVIPIVTSDLYLVDPGWDVGTFAGYREVNRSTADRPFTVGLRVSPVRLGYGVVAPDAVLAEDWAGAGLSLYLPEPLVGGAHHIGIGCWYGAPFDNSSAGGRAGWVYGLSFSFNH